MCFLIPQPEDMLTLPLNFNESQPIYAYERYTYKFKVQPLYFRNTSYFIFSIFNTCSIYILSDS